ncbi:MAG: UDP-N-acetylmuramate--L-alanine ligase, partial [Prevotella bivia]|nr:UDP-N-acetylmuramate--L-alanine ligase [Prevotella bivia]
REEPIEGVTSALIFDNLKAGIEKQLIVKDEVLNFVKSRDFDVLVILGAGNLDNYVPQIAQLIEDKE